MEEVLTKNDIDFVKVVAKTGNGSKSAKKAYEITNDNYARLKAHRQLKKPKIIKAIAEMLPDKLLGERHLELLNKREKVIIEHENDNGSDIYEVLDQPDTQAVSKGLDMAYKLKGSYAPEKSMNINIEVPVGKQKTATNAITRFLNGNK